MNSDKNPSSPFDAVARATLSLGASDDRIHAAVARVLRARAPVHARVVDVGCGRGALTRSLTGLFETYVGVDVVRYPGFPLDSWASFVEVDLNQARYPMAAAEADAVLAVEVIEHLENPRAFVRELVRLVRPGGCVVITTPNQLSLLSKLTLLTKNQFNAFQEGPGLYPTHITALLETDLRHIAQECGLVDIEVSFTNEGRVPLSSRRWPAWLGGRRFSDNILVTGKRG